ncbi:hypothetical protein Poli38472_009054 [Pythium oligandrum]|uniref:Sulfite exporter TauE/SafE n=1 Tax=Pythium oligandrum TaxID=41045 RepID=A0A8K1CM63_PYTOL|nr:hypothetical protein Poli38472_009054 [Pythium oligandrum]|eukprot:TMW64887.1 hypothetical protein Poli38472_009054 [Pythium oligandrum]
MWHRLTPLLLLLTLWAVVQAADVAAKTADEEAKATIPSVSDMDGYDVVGILFMALGLIISSAGGVGGGVIMVPAMVLIMGFDIKRATPISNAAIFGGAVANAWFNLQKRHPHVDRPLVDSDLCLVMIPVVIGGAVIGAIFSKLLPSYIITILFVLVLFASGIRTLQKGIRLHKKEVAAKKAKEEAGPSEPVPSPVATSANYVPALTPPLPSLDVKPVTDNQNETLAEILEREKHFSWTKQAVILVCYLGIVTASILNKVVDCGGVAYWVILMIEIPWVAVFSVFTSMYLLKAHYRKEAVDYPFAEGDVRWTKKAVSWFPVGCGVAGIIAGMFGVGGAIVTGPLMIEIGVVPEVVSATSALMVLYSAAAATAKFAVFDLIAWDWAGLLCGLAFVVTAISQVIILGYVRRTGRQSIVVLCIGTAIAVGAAIMTYQAVRVTIDDAGKHFSADVCS